jgi:hypothetical protein
MYLLIRHELNDETKARRDEVAETKARNRQRVAQLRQTSEEPSPTTGTLSKTQAKARAKDRTRVGNTLANGYMRANGAIGISLREHGKARGLLCQSTPCECACTGEKKRSRMRHTAILRAALAHSII